MDVARASCASPTRTERTTYGEHRVLPRVRRRAWAGNTLFGLGPHDEEAGAPRKTGGRNSGRQLAFLRRTSGARSL